MKVALLPRDDVVVVIEEVAEPPWGAATLARDYVGHAVAATPHLQDEPVEVFPYAL